MQQHLPEMTQESNRNTSCSRSNCTTAIISSDVQAGHVGHVSTVENGTSQNVPDFVCHPTSHADPGKSQASVSVRRYFSWSIYMRRVICHRSRKRQATAAAAAGSNKTDRDRKQASNVNAPVVDVAMPPHSSFPRPDICPPRTSAPPDIFNFADI